MVPQGIDELAAATDLGAGQVVVGPAEQRTVVGPEVVGAVLVRGRSIVNCVIPLRGPGHRVGVAVISSDTRGLH